MTVVAVSKSCIGFLACSKVHLPPTMTEMQTSVRQSLCRLAKIIKLRECMFRYGSDDLCLVCASSDRSPV